MVARQEPLAFVPPDPTFGQLLRRYRLTAGLSQEQLAEQSGLSVEAVNTLERGKRRVPRMATVARLVQALHLAAADREHLVAAVARGRDDVAGVTFHWPATPSLPMPLTSFIGRERLLASVQRALAGTRLLTLTGAGGSGKTRLAIEVAAKLQDQGEEVHFVGLALLHNATLVLPTLVRAIGLNESSDRPLEERLRHFIGTRSLLVVLDNFEHLLPSGPAVASLLATCPTLRLLVTSRTALGVSGEQQLPVPPFDLPDTTGRLPVAVLAQQESVRLFVERARALDPDFALDEDNTAVVLAICRRLDGLPLAIELAAGWTKLLPPQSLLSRLNHRLTLLVGGGRDLPERQRSIRATIDWSYSLLTAGERQLFRHLAVFAGNWTLAAAEAVCSDNMADGTALLLLASLQNQHLVQREAPSLEDDGAEPRFSMLESIREYALEQLAASGDAYLIQQRHALYYLDVAEQVGPELWAPAATLWLDQLEGEHDNLRTALRWFVTQRAVEQALRLGGALWRFWLARGYVGEGWAHVVTLLALTDAPVPSRARAEVLLGAGYLARFRADYSAARSLHEESLAAFRQFDDRPGIVLSLANLGHEACIQADYVTADALLEEGLALSRVSGDRYGVSLTLRFLGGLAHTLGDYALAQSRYTEALHIAQRDGDLTTLAWLPHEVGRTAIAQKDYVAARKWLVAGMQALWRQGRKPGILYCLVEFSRLAAAEGQGLSALRLAGAAESLSERMGARVGKDARGRLRRQLEHAHCVVENEDADAAWAEGREMPTEGAITYALEQATAS